MSAPASAAGLPPQGLYEGCAPSRRHQCAAELAQMGRAGFQLVLDYSAWYGSASDIRTYASEARMDGLKVIWPLNNSVWRDRGSSRTLPSTYSRLAAGCGCKTNAAFVRYAIGLVRSLPGTWGYYVGDELSPSQAPAVALLAGQVRKLDAAHPLLYVGAGSSNVRSTLAPFEKLANVVGADVYPIGTGASASAVAPVASAVAQLSSATGTLPAVVLQAFSWSEYPGQVHAVAPRWPTEAEMQAMRDQALSIHPSLILWYSLFDVLRSYDPAGHWRDLVLAAFAPAPHP